jgi:hypothetical protein
VSLPEEALLPWGIVKWMLGGMGTAVVALALERVRVGKVYGKLLREKDKALTESVALREKVRAELQAKLDNLTNEIREKLERDLDEGFARRRGGVHRGSVREHHGEDRRREKRPLTELLDDYQEKAKTGFFRRDELDLTGTQELGAPPRA